MKLIAFLFLLLFVAGAYAADVNSRYTTALDKLQQGKRLEALQEFRDLAATNPKNQLCGNFHFWSGEALLGLGRTDEAVVEYTLAFNTKNSNKEKHARFMLGQCYQKLGHSDWAKAEWERFLRDYPEDELAPKVKQKLAS